MQKFLFGIFLISLNLSLRAQTQDGQRPDERIYDVGEIPEEGGIVYHVFSITNTGSDTLWLPSAKGHCHCTSGDILTPCIAPGKTGKIRVSYDPKGRPWPIDAGLDVKPGKGEKFTLKLTGTVTSGKKTPRFSPAEFTQKFDFNEKAIETSRQQFRKFVEGMLPLLERNGVVNVQIESSASTVPTKAFASNEELTRARAASARAEILQILREAGAIEERLNFLPDDTKVQGPDYEQDIQKNPADYLPFQFVKVRVF